MLQQTWQLQVYLSMQQQNQKNTKYYRARRQFLYSTGNLFHTQLEPMHSAISKWSHPHTDQTLVQAIFVMLLPPHAYSKI